MNRTREEVRTTQQDRQAEAAALFDGGWRAEDREALAGEYDLSQEDLDSVCALLAQWAQEERKGKK